MDSTSANAVMKPLMATAMKLAGKGKKASGKRKAEVKMKLKSSVKVKA